MILFQHETIIQDKREDYPSPIKIATESPFFDIYDFPDRYKCGSLHSVLWYCILRAYPKRLILLCNVTKSRTI